MLIFVYGTLKRNEPNYHLMGRYGVFEDDGEIQGDYKLVVGSQYFIPFLLPIDQSEKSTSSDQSEKKMMVSSLYFLLIKSHFWKISLIVDNHQL